MKISKKILSIIMVLLLVVGIVPTSVMTVFATGTHEHCVCGGNTNVGDHTSHSDIAFTEWTYTDAMPTETGNYVLMNDVTLDDDWETADGTVLCLNGKTLTLEAVNARYDFTLCDCAGNGKIIGSGRSVYTIAMTGSATFTMYGGTVLGGDGQSGVYVYGNFNMYGGIITNGDADGTMNVNCKNGGGVYIESIGSAATMTMYGGSITGNQATNTGGGVFVENNATFIMNGGSITNNTSKETGGGVHNNGTFIINGGTITENISTDSTGGGVWSANNTTISISGDTIITENTGSSTTNNLHLAGDGTNNAKIAVGTMGTSASVGVSTDTNHSKEISVGGKDYKNNFFFDNTGYVIAVDGDNLKLVEATGVQVGQVTLKNGEYIRNGSTEIQTDEPTGEGYAYYTGGVLKLNNFEYEGVGENESIIYFDKALDIEIIGDNTLKPNTQNSAAAIYAQADYNIYGNGVLNIENNSANDCSYGIREVGSGITKTIKDITLNITLSQNESHGFLNQGISKLVIDNAAVNINTNEHCFYVSEVEITNSVLSLVSNDTTFKCMDGVSLNNCYVNAKATNGNKIISISASNAINIGDGHYILDGGDDVYGALYFTNATLNLPASDYYYRTAKDADFVKNSVTPFTYTNQKYIELFTEDRIVPVEIEWSADSLTYNGTEQAITATIKNKADVNDDVALVLSGDKGTNANTYTATVTGITGRDAAKYTLDGVQNLTKNWEITKAEQAAPTTPIGVDTTYIDTADGKITGVDSTMEYRKSGETDYTAVVGTEITNLSAGTYYVRYAAKPNYNASPDTEIVISEGGKRTAAIEITATLDKTYDGAVVADPTYDYAGNGEITIKWYEDDNGVKGNALSEVPKNAGTYWVGVSASASENYNAVAEVTEQFTIAKATPTIDTEPEASRVLIDGKLSDSTLTNGKASVDGKFEWKNGTDVLEVEGTVQKTVVFTPDDAENYNPVEFEIEVEVVVCDTESGEHDYTEQKNNDDEHWIVCAKCKVEQPNSREAHKGGTATCEAKAKCSECGKEYGDLGVHDYENGKCKVCGATDPNYKPTSPQTGDNSNMTLWIALLFISGMGLVGTTVYGRKKRQAR